MCIFFFGGGGSGVDIVVEHKTRREVTRRPPTIRLPVSSARFCRRCQSWLPTMCELIPSCHDILQFLMQHAYSHLH